MINTMPTQGMQGSWALFVELLEARPRAERSSNRAPISGRGRRSHNPSYNPSHNPSSGRGRPSYKISGDILRSQTLRYFKLRYFKLELS